MYSGVLASSGVSPALRSLLQQGAIPLSMGLSRVFLKRIYFRQHLVGAAMLIVGIAVCCFQIILDPRSNGKSGRDGHNSDAWWSILFFCGCVPLTIGGCMKEWILTHPRKPVDMNLVNFWVAFAQLIISVVTSPVFLAIQNAMPNSHDISTAD